MKLTYASYQHTAIGFPHVILKWSYTPEKGHHDFYHTILGVVRIWNTAIDYRPHHKDDLDREIKRFEEHVRFRYSENISVQG